MNPRERHALRGRRAARSQSHLKNPGQSSHPATAAAALYTPCTHTFLSRAQSANRAPRPSPNRSIGASTPRSLQQPRISTGCMDFAGSRAASRRCLASRVASFTRFTPSDWRNGLSMQSCMCGPVRRAVLQNPVARQLQKPLKGAFHHLDAADMTMGFGSLTRHRALCVARLLPFSQLCLACHALHSSGITGSGAC